MTRHQKRLAVPDSWPVERKEQVYTVKADAGPHGEAGVPLLVLLRDVLEYVASMKEARYALGQNSVLVNGTPVSDEQRPIGMFDILAFTEREEFYRVFPDEGGRLALTPIDEDDAQSKLGKVDGKTQVGDGRYQLTLHDGQTLVVEDESYSPNDSIVVSNDDGEIIVHFPYETGELVTAVRGQHAGKIGTLEEIQVTPGSSPNNVWVTQDDGDGFETIEEYVVVIDENFTGEASEEPRDATAEPEETEDTAEPEETDDTAEPEESDDTAEPDAGDESTDIEPDEADTEVDEADEREDIPDAAEADEEGVDSDESDPEQNEADEADVADEADETDETDEADEADETDEANEANGTDVESNDAAGEIDVADRSGPGSETETPGNDPAKTPVPGSAERPRSGSIPMHSTELTNPSRPRVPPGLGFGSGVDYE